MIYLLYILLAVVVARLAYVAVQVMRGIPDVNIGPDYMFRWHVVPRNRLFNVYLHKIMKDDDDRALHDHPWHSLSWMLKGQLREVWYQGQIYSAGRIVRPSLRPVYRPAKYAHRLEVVRPTWTLFITGPRVREWGFHCPKGWVHWRKFVDAGDKGKVGRGCGEA